MNNPAECRICFTTFSKDENHRPRTFPCGHTFCSSCITGLLRQGTIGRLTCPTCRAKHVAPNAAQFPISYDMEALIQQMKGLAEQQQGPETTENQEEETGEPQETEVEAMREWVVNVLFECSTVMTQLEQRQDKLERPQAKHMSLLNQLCEMVVDNKKAMTQLTRAQGKYRGLLDEGQGIASHLQAMVDQLENSASARGSRAIVNLANSRMQAVEMWMKKCKEMTASDTTAASSDVVLTTTHDRLKQMAENFGNGEGGACSGGDAGGGVSSSQVTSVLERAQHSLEELPSRPSTLTTEDLRTLNADVRRLLEGRVVFGLLQDSGAPRCSSLTLENGRLHLYHLQDQPPPCHAHTIQMASYLSAPHPSLLVFLDLAWRGEVHGRVYIRLNLLVPLARQFLLLCSGQQGPSYAGTSLLKFMGGPDLLLREGLACSVSVGSERGCAVSLVARV